MRLLIFGLGYVGSALAHAAAAEGCTVTGNTRSTADDVMGLDAATHLLSTVAPDAAGDPVLLRHAAVIARAPRLRWVGYLSTTGVYGDRNGAWVDEQTEPAPVSERARRRLAAEQAWTHAAQGRALDVFRLAGIYGPGRSVFDDLRGGRARRVLRPGHAFGRIHRDDIVSAILAAVRQERAPEPRILNLTDDKPAESAVVIGEAASLLGIAPPPSMPFEQALPSMSPMARSFWAENRRVCSRWTQQALGLRWRYPTYREGLRAILADERQQRAP